MFSVKPPPDDEDFPADPVELFFDLAFVFAFSQVVLRLVHRPELGEVAKTGLLFMLMWVAWSQFAWSTNAISASSRTMRAIILVATAASLPMAAGVETAYEQGGRVFAGSLAVIMVMAIAAYQVGLDRAEHQDVFRSAVLFAAPLIVSAGLIFVGPAFEGSTRTAVWLAALAVSVWATIKAGDGDWIVRPGHFAERHGLIIIVALGEVIVAIGISVTSALEEGEGFSSQVIWALIAAGTLAGLLWWSYFDLVHPAREHRLASATGRERGRLARDLYTYAAIPTVAGVLLIAAAVEEISLHPKDVLPENFRLMALAGFVLYLSGFVMASYRARHSLPVERTVAMAALAVTLLVGKDWDGVTHLIVVDLILLAMVVSEARLHSIPRVAATSDIA